MAVQYALARNTAVFADIESVTYGTWPVGFPTGTDAFLVYGDAATAFRLDPRFSSYEPLSGTLTPKKQVLSGLGATSQLECLLQGGGQGTGSTGDPAPVPYFSKLWRMCGLELTTTNGTGGDSSRTLHTYTFRDTDFESGALAIYHEGIRGGISGAYGTFRMEGTAGAPVRMLFTIGGQVHDITDVDPPSPTLPPNRAFPLQKTAMKFAGHSVFADYEAPNLFARSFVLDMGWTTPDRPDFAQITSERGLAGKLMTERKPTLELVIEAERDLSHYDPFDRLLKDNSEDSITWTMKSLEGTPVDEIRFSINNPHLLNVQRTTGEGGILLYTLSFELQNDTAKNEMSLVVASLEAA